MLKIIGSIERCALKDLGIPEIDARIDTGAKTSSIQATNIKVIKKGKQKWATFEVNYQFNDKDFSISCEAPLVARRTVKTSNENSEKRYIIKTPMTLGNATYEVEFTLANRETMEFKMLLGREALNGRFLVNPAETYLLK